MANSRDGDPVLNAIAARALDFVREGSVVGLGSGRAATAFVRALGERVRSGLHVRGVPTSEATAGVARDAGVPLIGLADVATIAVTVDGADEVDPQLDMIKGYGGALVREKIVAAASQTVIILVGSEKLVPVLGSRGIVPVEVLPFAAAFCTRRLATLGCRPTPRQVDGRLFTSDSGNHILDCGVDPISAPQALEDSIRAIPGVVGTGLFLGVADIVLVGEAADVRELRRRIV
jgi:ribose 5-phosphate isomerase A